MELMRPHGLSHWTSRMPLLLCMFYLNTLQVRYLYSCAILSFCGSFNSWGQSCHGKGEHRLRRTYKELLMPRKKPASRIVVQRSRNNANRRLIALLPTEASRAELSARVTYGGYSKHKFNPTAYKLTPYAGQDVERTYCDAHAKFGKDSFERLPTLLARGVMLGLWSEQNDEGVPSLLWTIDESGWIFELRITNSGQAQYHGYPVLPGDAFARHVLGRAREVLFAEGEFPIDQAPSTQAAIEKAETFYR